MKRDGYTTLETILKRTKDVLTGKVMRPSFKGDDFDKGITQAEEMDYVIIDSNNVWGGPTKDGGWLFSYERIGYHRGSADFAAGLIEAGCPVYVGINGKVLEVV